MKLLRVNLFCPDVLSSLIVLGWYYNQSSLMLVSVVIHDSNYLLFEYNPHIIYYTVDTLVCYSRMNYLCQVQYLTDNT